MMASFHNVFLFFFLRTKKTWPDETKVILAKDSIEDFKKIRQRFQFEWEKLK
jgi:hypothetical protein